MQVAGSRWVTFPWSSCDSSACSLCPAAVLQSQDSSNGGTVSPSGLLSHVLDTLLNPNATRDKLASAGASEGGNALNSLSDAFRTHQIRPPGHWASSCGSESATCIGMSGLSTETHVESDVAAAATGVRGADLAVAVEASTTPAVSKGRPTRRRYSLDEDARDDLQVKRKTCVTGQVVLRCFRCMSFFYGDMQTYLHTYRLLIFTFSCSET